MPSPIQIATRGSALALAQAHFVRSRCTSLFPEHAFELLILKTTGDKLQTASLASPSLPKGLFTKELELALLQGQADLAVHSLKDLPTDLPEGLTLGAVPARADVRDVLISRQRTEEAQAQLPLSVATLPPQATVATSSTRRRAQLLALRPDLNVVPIRGNVGTRLRKLAENTELDGLILAAAGLQRLQFLQDGKLAGEGVPAGLEMSFLPLSEMLPCVGQAALGIEIRDHDPRAEAICRALNDPESAACVTAERSFLQAMGGGCQLAVAAHATHHQDILTLKTISFLGPRPQRAEGRCSIKEAAALGTEVAARLKP